MSQESENRTFPGGGDIDTRYLWPSDEMENIDELKRLEVRAATAHQNKEFDLAAELYTEAITIMQRRTGRLFSNRSLIHTELKRFDDAFADAIMCTENLPGTLGYWRQSQALKGMEDYPRALSCLVKGYDLCDNELEAVTFMSEIVTTLCLMKDHMMELPYNFGGLTFEKFPDLDLKVLNKLASCQNWEAISLLVLGIHPGPSNHFEQIASNTSAREISIGNLIQSLPSSSMKEWGMKLLVALIRNDASILEMERKLSQPAIHIGITLALDTGNLDMLSFLFDTYLVKQAQKDATDENGNTGLHLLVQYDNRSTSRWKSTLYLLVNNGCSRSIINKDGKTPMEYLNSEEQDFIKTAEIEAVSERKKRIQNLKAKGIQAIKNKQPTVAVKYYTEAYNMCDVYQTLQSEKVILLTNRSAAYFEQQWYQRAYFDAIKAIELDPSWYKGHWWKGLAQRKQGKHKESFQTFLEGYKKSEPEKEAKYTRKVQFLYEAVLSLTDSYQIDYTTGNLYDKLIDVTEIEWTQVLIKLSTDEQWLAIRILVMGTDEMIAKHHMMCKDPTTDMTTKGLGLAANASPNQMQLSTIFSFIKDHDSDDYTYMWITKLFIALLGNEENVENATTFFESTNDTPIHAAVKFSIIVGNTLLMRQVLPKGKYSYILDKNGDSVYHIVTQTDLSKISSHLVMVAAELIEKGFALNVKDQQGKTAIEYVNQNEQDDLYELLLSSEMTVQGAIEHGRYKILCTLFERGANPELLSLQQGDTPLHAALSIALEKDKGNFTIFKKLLDMHESDPEKYTILDPTLTNLDGDSLYHIVAKTEFKGPVMEAMEILCDKKLPILAVNKDCKMPQDYIRKNDRRWQFFRLASLYCTTQTMKDTRTAEIVPENKMSERHNKADKKESTKERIEDTIVRIQDVPYLHFKKPSQKKNLPEMTQELQEIHVEYFYELDWQVECTTNAWKHFRQDVFPLDIKKKAITKIQQLAKGEWHSLCKKIPEVKLNVYTTNVAADASIVWELLILPSFVDGENRDNNHTSPHTYTEVICIWDIVFNDDIRRCIEVITESHNKSKHCTNNKELKPMEQSQSTVEDNKRYPKFYTETDSQLSKNTTDGKPHFFQPVLADQNRCHVLKLHSFCSSLVYHVLRRSRTNVDFPIHLTDVQNTVICQETDLPIIVLGRSGSGKTTCCVYRMLKQFTDYWSQGIDMDSPRLPRIKCHIARGEYKGKHTTDNIEEKVSDHETEDTGDEQDRDENEIYDHLHQVFVSKNAVNCSEVKKTFVELCNGNEKLPDCIKTERQHLPLRLQEVDDTQYPLFVTLKTLLVMLDASLGSNPFFKRTDDGRPKDHVDGWTDTQDTPPNIFTDSIVEDEQWDFGDMKIEADCNAEQTQKTKSKTDHLREMTYDVFVSEVWPKTSKYVKKYHPGIIWTEIISLIEGSYEALSTSSGFLTKDEYLELGKKKSLIFTDDRTNIYEFYKSYNAFKREKNLFDKMDIVQHIYGRLKQDARLPWAIHHLSVDDVQNFTQAELFLFVKICQDPNRMFLTGDADKNCFQGTASIFNYVRNIFYYAGQTIRTEVIRETYLPFSFSSTDEMIILASSVLELIPGYLSDISKHSNRGIMHGPKPVLVESSSVRDLVFHIRGRYRTLDTALGAQQAILVLNETTRKNICEELANEVVLTIGEASALQFDDVLLYNFFQDSHDTKAWKALLDHYRDTTDVPGQVKTQRGKSKRILKFDINDYKHLIPELNFLYTAVTRARVNLWIFDEDIEKRDPMFEYFKSRGVVEILTSDNDVDKFSVQSSSQEWRQRGEDFLKHGLFKEAAKCEKLYGSDTSASLARANQYAYLAPRTTKTQKENTEMFLLAAEIFLNCEQMLQAAKCLFDAGQGELLAQLYEKAGQLKLAAELYKKVKKPLECSRCYEELGWFDQAIKILCENELYDWAVHVLARYNLMKNQCEMDDGESNNYMALVLKDHAPNKQLTTECLSFKAATYYHNVGNEAHMFINLDRLPQINVKIDFLTARGYHEKAAELLQKERKFEDSARLYLIAGSTKKAVRVSRRSGNKKLQARCMLVHAQVLIRQKSVEGRETRRQDALCALQKVIDFSKKNGMLDTGGEACLLKGELLNEISVINDAWAMFSERKPFRNITGQLECMNCIINALPFDPNPNFRQVIECFRDLFSVLDTLLLPGDSTKMRMREDVYNYYGLDTVDQSSETLKMYPLQRPRALDIVKTCLYETALKAMDYKIEREIVMVTLCKYLLQKGLEWLHKVKLTLHNVRLENVQCIGYLMGTECSGNTTEKECKYLHVPLTSQMVRTLLELDMHMVELDHFIVDGVRKTEKHIPGVLKSYARAFIPDKSHNPLEKFKSCEILLKDLMPRHFQPWQTFDSRKACDEIRKHITKDSVKVFVLRYLRAKYDYMETFAKNQNIDVFLNLIFLTSYFNTSADVTPRFVMTQFEEEVFRDVSSRIEYHKRKQELDALGYILNFRDVTGQHKIKMQCIARKFLEAYELLSVRGDAMESLIKFTEFIAILGDRNEPSILPEFRDFLMWVEFYSTVCYCFAAKFRQETGAFYLPLSYINTVHFVDSALYHSYGDQTFELIQRYRPRGTESYSIQSQFKKMLAILCGLDMRMNMISLVFKNREDYQVDYLLAERLLVLILTILCNIGGVVGTGKEAHIVQSLLEIELPCDTPSRLRKAVQSVQNSKGQFDIANALIQLLLERNNENFIQCTWKDTHGIDYEPLQTLCVFGEGFVCDNTLQMVSNRSKQPSANEQNEKLAEETGLSKEETVKSEREMQHKAKQKHAAIVIQRFLKHRIFLKKCLDLSMLIEKHLQEKKCEEFFATIVIDDEVCGVCGVRYTETSILPTFELLYSNENVSSLRQIQLSMLSHDAEELSREQSEKATKENQKEILTSRHLNSAEHVQKNIEFAKFKATYRDKIAPSLEKVILFIRKYRQTHKKEPYKDINLDLQILGSCFAEVENQLKKIMREKIWHDDALLFKKEQEMVETYSTIYEKIKRNAKVFS